MEKTKGTTVAIAEAHLSRYATSGMTQLAYCTEHGINKATFAYWLKRKRDGERKGEFIRIEAKGRGGAMEVRYANGNVISFQTVVDVKYLKELLG